MTDELRSLLNQVQTRLDNLDWRKHFQDVNAKIEGAKLALEFVYKNDKYETLYYDEQGNYLNSINDSPEEVTEEDREYQSHILNNIECLR